MSDEYILDDVVETFSDEDRGMKIIDDLSDDFLDGLKDVAPDGSDGQSGDNVQLDAKGEPLLRDLRHESTVKSDIRNNPVKWLLSMAVLGPGVAYTLSGKTSYEAALGAWGLPTGLEWILGTFVTGLIFIAPLSCYYLSRTGNVASGLFIAMGGSAVLVANPYEIARFSEVLGASFFLFCVALSTPMLMVLRNKKKLLDPGKERITWCTLFSAAIMMYTVAVIVPSAGVALVDVSCEDDSGALLSEVDIFAGATDACEALQFRYTPMLGMAAAIGWAWPRGKKSLEEEICPHCGSKKCCLKSSKTKDENSLDGAKDGEKSDGQSDDSQQDTNVNRGKKIIDDLSDDFLDGLKD